MPRNAVMQNRSPLTILCSEGRLHLEARLILCMISIRAVVQRFLKQILNNLFAKDYTVMEVIPLMLIGSIPYFLKGRL